MSVLVGLLGAVIVVGTLVELFETIVLPRRVTRRFRMVRLLYRGLRVPAYRLGQAFPRRREAILAVFGPLALTVVLVSWVASIIAGFAFLQWSIGSDLSTGGQAHMGLGDDLYFSATTFLTLGLGDIAPRGGAARALAALEAAGGFGVLALVIGYLPTLYQAFARRETAVSLLDARAGSPPSAVELVRRYARDGAWEELIAYLKDWESWAADLMESHLSYPMLSYFRSQHDNQNWLAALTTILDTCALLIAGFPQKQHRAVKLTFALCRHFAVDLSQVLFAPPLPPVPERLTELDLARLRTILAESGLTLPDDEVLLPHLSALRESYEPYVGALADRLMVALPTWLPPDTLTDDWRSTAWDPRGRVLL